LRPIPTGTLLGVPADPSTLDSSGMSDVDNGGPLLGPGEDVAVGRLVRARYGDAVVDRLVDPLLGGVYAGHADRLSLAATMPGLHQAAQEQPTLSAAVTAALAAAPRPAGTAVFASVRGGLSRFVAAVAQAGRAQPRLGLPARQLTRTPSGWSVVVGSMHDWVTLEADAVVLAVPARPAARLLGPVAPEAAAAVGALDYASVALVTLALPPGTELPELSGFLVPAVQRYAVKAATFFGRKWPHLAAAQGPVLVRASLGRYCEEGVLQRSDADLAALALADLRALLGLDLPEPRRVMVSRWGGGLPQYAVGHVDRIAAARAALPPGLALAGALADGVGIAACVRSGYAAADQLLDRYLVRV
jgi:oxygen-dependent protoporphyrinogen oxidase